MLPAISARVYINVSIYKLVEDAVTWRCLGFFGVFTFPGGGGWAGNLRVLGGGNLQQQPKMFYGLCVCVLRSLAGYPFV